MRASPATRRGDRRLAFATVDQYRAATPKPRNRSPQSGSYLLEFALAALAVAFAIVGVSDLSTIFHARSAVHAGVVEGLRCLYPSDPTCTSETPPSAEISGSRYNAWVWGSEGMLLPQTSFLVSTSLFNEPIREVPRVASKVSSVRVSYGSSGFAAHVVQFPVAAHAPYLVTIRDLPLLGGVDPLRPTFLDRYTKRDITPNRAFAIQMIKGVGERVVPSVSRDEYDSSFEIGSRSFTFSDAWVNRALDGVTIAEIATRYSREVPCYRGEVDYVGGAPRIRWNLSRAPKVCSHRALAGDGSTVQRNLLQGSVLHVPIMLRISGVPVGMSSRAVGKIVARLEWRNGRASGSRELGGRVFSKGGSATLIVRGAERSDIQESAWRPYEERYAREIELHGTLPLIPVDATVTIRLFLSSVSGDPVGWEGREIEVFYPRYQFVHEVIPCGYSSSPEECAVNPAPLRALYTTLESGRALISKQEGTNQCRRNEPTPIEPSAEVVLNRISDSIRRGEAPRGYSFWLRTGDQAEVCRPVVKTHECSDDYRDHLKGCRPDYTPEYIRTHCQMDDYRPELDEVTAISVAEEARLATDKRGQCSEEPFPACAAPYSEDAGVRFLGAGSNNCSSAINVSPAPERNGPFYDNLCESVSDKMRERYRVIHKIPADIPISVVSLSEPPVYTGKPPSDSCMASEPIGGGDRRRVLCGRGVSRLAARRCCEQHEGRCALEELSPAPGRVGSGLFHVVEEAAEARVIETIQSIYPSARNPTGCDAGSENCVSVEARVVANDSIARVRASVKVPLTVSSWFRGTGVTLDYQEERALERARMNG